MRKNNVKGKFTMKRKIALALSAAMAMSLTACGGNTAATATTAAPAATEAAKETAAPTEAPKAEPTEIALWTYPIGKWGDQATVDALIADFNEDYPDIKVKVEYLTYTDGDDKVNTAIEGKTAPDIIMEGPERLVANWGAKGVMVDLSDLWTDNVKADTYASVEAACKDASGAYYEYPLCMTAHCMAINRDVFEATGAWQYVDEATHTWTTENFLKAVQTLYDAGHTNVGAVFCGGQGGDQGTRALINNLYGGTFTNAEHTAYTANSAENVKALEALVAQDGINFDPAIVGGDEINLFVQGVLQMAFCWNIAQEANNAEALTFDAFPMAFPSDDGVAELCGGIWGFGVFDNGDAAKIDAAKTFVKWACDENTEACVEASTYWSTRESLSNMYEGDDMKTEYGQFMQFMGDYYQVVPGWATARTEWWNMLQKVGAGDDITASVETFVTNANAAAAQ